MKVYSADPIDRLVAHLNDDPTVEILPRSDNPWIYCHYRREEAQGDNPQSGSYEYGTIYKNAKGRFTLTGLAVSDYKEFHHA